MRTSASCLDFFLSTLEYSCPHQTKTVFLVPVHPMTSENQDDQAGSGPSEGQRLPGQRKGRAQAVPVPPLPPHMFVHAHTHTPHSCAHTHKGYSW